MHAQTKKPGLFMKIFMTRRGGGVILQTASQHAYFSTNILQIFSKDLRYFSKILQNTKNFDDHLQFAAIFAKFYENRGENE